MPRSGTVTKYNRSNVAVKTQAFLITPMVVINALLCAMVLFLVAFYIVRANGLVARSYRADILRQSLASLEEQSSILVSQKASLKDTILLSEFAKSHNMIEARNIKYLFESGNVALRQGGL